MIRGNLSIAAFVFFLYCPTHFQGIVFHGALIFKFTGVLRYLQCNMKKKWLDFVSIVLKSEYSEVVEIFYKTTLAPLTPTTVTAL